MLGFPLRLSRSMRRLVGALCLAGAAPAYAASADDALMALEHAQARYEAMLDSAQYASGLLRVLYEDRAAVPDTIEIADTQVRKSFKVPVAMTAMREAMAQTPDLPDDQVQALARIAKDWAQRDAALRALPEAALAAEGEAMARRMAERQDADAIEALLPLMAEPALAEENVLAAERVYRLMEILVVEGHAQAKAEIELHGDEACAPNSSTSRARRRRSTGRWARSARWSGSGRCSANAMCFPICRPRMCARCSRSTRARRAVPSVTRS